MADILLYRERSGSMAFISYFWKREESGWEDLWKGMRWFDLQQHPTVTTVPPHHSTTCCWVTIIAGEADDEFQVIIINQQLICEWAVCLGRACVCVLSLVVSSCVCCTSTARAHTCTVTMTESTQVVDHKERRRMLQVVYCSSFSCPNLNNLLGWYVASTMRNVVYNSWFRSPPTFYSFLAHMRTPMLCLLNELFWNTVEIAVFLRGFLFLLHLLSKK